MTTVHQCVRAAGMYREAREPLTLEWMREQVMAWGLKLCKGCQHTYSFDGSNVHGIRNVVLLQCGQAEFLWPHTSRCYVFATTRPAFLAELARLWPKAASIPLPKLSPESSQPVAPQAVSDAKTVAKADDSNVTRAVYYENLVKSCITAAGFRVADFSNYEAAVKAIAAMTAERDEWKRLAELHAHGGAIAGNVTADCLKALAAERDALAVKLAQVREIAKEKA